MLEPLSFKQSNFLSDFRTHSYAIIMQ
jgi:hypothetical protein